MDAARLFDEWARKGRAEGMEQGHMQTAGPTLASLGVGPGDHMLDLGCGNGWASRFARGQGAAAVGVDASEEMVRKASRHGPAVRADFTHLPFADATFSHLWSMEAIYYAADPDAVLGEMRRVCRPDAKVAILIDFYGENVDSHSWPVDVGVPMALRSEAEWVDALRTAGFDAAASRLLADDPAAEAWKRTQGTLLLRA